MKKAEEDILMQFFHFLVEIKLFHIFNNTLFNFL